MFALPPCLQYPVSFAFAVMFVLLNNASGLNDEPKCPDAARSMSPGLRFFGSAFVHHACGDFGGSFGRKVSFCGSTWGSRRFRRSPTRCQLLTSLSSSVRSLSDIDRMLVSTAGDMYGITPRNFGSVVMTFGSFLSTVVDPETEGVQFSLRELSWEK
jgi:hypothetical protein